MTERNNEPVEFVTILPHFGDKVGLFEPWMAEAVTDAASGKIYRTSDLDKIATAISDLFQGGEDNDT